MAVAVQVLTSGQGNAMVVQPVGGSCIFTAGGGGGAGAAGGAAASGGTSGSGGVGVNTYASFANCNWNWCQ
jgi:hypothetical protein